MVTRPSPREERILDPVDREAQRIELPGVFRPRQVEDADLAKILALSIWLVVLYECRGERGPVRPFEREAVSGIGCLMDRGVPPAVEGRRSRTIRTGQGEGRERDGVVLSRKATAA